MYINDRIENTKCTSNCLCFTCSNGIVVFFVEYAILKFGDYYSAFFVIELFLLYGCGLFPSTLVSFINKNWLQRYI